VNLLIEVQMTIEKVAMIADYTASQ
jgi:hypothetical protein